MTRWRLFFDRLLLAGAVFMAVVSLILIVSTIRTVRDVSQSLNDNLTFYASQVEYETMQLLDFIDRYGEADDSVALEDVLVRYDILWSRVFNRNDEDTFGTDPTTIALAQSTVGTYQSVLQSIEADISSLDRDDLQTASRLKSRLRELVPAAQKMRLAAKDSRVLGQTTYLRNQLRQSYLISGFILGTLAFGVLSILLLRADRGEIRSMNVRLEDRVRQRTEDLQSANRRLASEIAERIRNQDLAAEREARLEQAVQLAKLGYYVWDVIDDRCEFSSGQHSAAFGLTPPEFQAYATSREGALSLIHPEDREALREKYNDLREGRIIEVGYRVLTRSGVRRLREVSRPIFDSSGQIIREVGSTLDVTDQYDTEMKLFEAQKMDSIGKMTGGVAHDFNNLLAVILGNLELLKEVPDSSDRDEMIEDAIRATLRGRDLTMSMLSFARRAPLDPTDLNLNSIVDDMQGMLRRTLPENISVEVALAEDVMTVAADRSLTESALLNLAINARDAMPDGGKLTIETANITFGEETILENGEDIAPGSYVMMAVTDTGRGIRKELLANIFEPFFTTKAITKNSGLGLSMVQGFIKQTGGTIRVYSEPGVGTTFKLFFKSADAKQGEATGIDPDRVLSAGYPLHVLLVEDEPTVRKILTRQLEKSGMSVASASESAAAELLFKTEGPFDVVVSDIVMPGDLQGPALIRRLREFEPDLPAVLLSGYPQEATVHGNGVRHDDVVLMKPVSREDLIVAINLVVSPSQMSDA